MNISAKQVKALRDITGAGMMDCKKALAEAEGDFDKAIDIMRKKGLARASKRAEKSANEGLIGSYLSADGKIGVLLELNCETDFVARTPDFRSLAEKLIVSIAEGNPAEDGWKDLLIDGQNAGEALSSLSAKMGEKMELRHFARYQAENGLLDTYIHPGARLGVMLEIAVEGEVEKARGIAHELAMQIAAANPIAIHRDEVSAEDIEKELEIYRAQARNEGKPEKIIDRIAEGKLGKFYSEVCLLEQPYIKEAKTRVSAYLAEACEDLGIKVEPRRFVKFVLGGN